MPKRLRQNSLLTQLEVNYVFYIIFIFYRSLYNKYVDSFSQFTPNILISSKDIFENSYKQLKTRRKINSRKASLKILFQKRSHSTSSSALLALLGCASNGVLVQTEQSGTLHVLKKCFVA